MRHVLVIPSCFRSFYYNTRLRFAPFRVLNASSCPAHQYRIIPVRLTFVGARRKTRRRVGNRHDDTTVSLLTRITARRELVETTRGRVGTIRRVLRKRNEITRKTRVVSNGLCVSLYSTRLKLITNELWRIPRGDNSSNTPSTPLEPCICLGTNVLLRIEFEQISYWINRNHPPLAPPPLDPPL